jgi:hypothetical protein
MAMPVAMPRNLDRAGLVKKGHRLLSQVPARLVTPVVTSGE